MLELMKNTIGTDILEEVKLSDRLGSSLGALNTAE